MLQDTRAHHHKDGAIGYILGRGALNRGGRHLVFGLTDNRDLHIFGGDPRDRKQYLPWTACPHPSMSQDHQEVSTPTPPATATVPPPSPNLRPSPPAPPRHPPSCRPIHHD